MFLNNSRIENYKGIKFYEQDIAVDDYVYSGDVKIVLKADYITPGIGIALIKNEGFQVLDQRDVYLFKIGYKSVNIFLRHNDVCKSVYSSSILTYPPVNDFTMTLNKTGNTITLSIEGLGPICSYTINNLNKYNIGIYSNAGNTIKSISVASMVPANWAVNMLNTNGGYIKFLKNGFELTNCDNNAEIEQNNIQLSPGKYYLNYETANNSDIKAYVYYSNDTITDDDTKNILKPNGTFDITDYIKSINIKFKGKNGLVKNIHVSDDKNDKYVPTINNEVLIDGSYINIDTTNIKKITWEGKIINYSNTNSDAFIFINGSYNLTPSNSGLIINKTYTFKYDINSRQLLILDKERTVLSKEFAAQNRIVTLFKNIDAIISDFELLYENGDTVNLVVQETSKKYVSTSITSPIIVTDDDNHPLDLSSSFRFIDKNGIRKYIFSNYEREIFEPANFIKLEKQPSDIIGSIKVYGINKNSKVNPNNLYAIPEEGMDTIDLFCDNYDVLNEYTDEQTAKGSVVFIDYDNLSLYLDGAENYKLIVIDYLKQNSYCINQIKYLNMYEIDISTDKPNTNLIYDHKAESNNSISVSNYKTTNIMPIEGKYIVLKRGDN